MIEYDRAHLRLINADSLKNSQARSGQDSGILAKSTPIDRPFGRLAPWARSLAQGGTTGRLANGPNNEKDARGGASWATTGRRLSRGFK